MVDKKKSNRREIIMDVYTFIDWTWTMLGFGMLAGFMISMLLDWVW